ncbi:5493_t:CDS:2 [Diversispora eburnea]|uniref:5493_t:CDS:1 n=1 Tax=Diversispora eburnea TaxID=1213867 RepID=A0A9N8ZR42_9GLOM|nr:5493_t:CDS:2 [Diversispora eburnea]
MHNESIINYLISPIDDTFQFRLSFDSGTSLHREQDITGTTSSLINEQDIATTSSIIHEQEIQIESSTFSNSHAKSKVWNYFTKPYGPSQSRKTKCHECGNEFSYYGSTSSLKYHLVHRHKIDMSTNLSHVKRHSRQIPSRRSNFFPYSEPSFLSEGKNSLLQSSPISLANKKSKVWEYFTMPYGSFNDKNCKTKCLKCEMEFSYNGSPSSLKYHLIQKHNIDIFTNSDLIEL